MLFFFLSFAGNAPLHLADPRPCRSHEWPQADPCQGDEAVPGSGELVCAAIALDGDHLAEHLPRMDKLKVRP